MEHGINLMDTVMYNSSAAEPIAQGLKGRRDKNDHADASGCCLPQGMTSRVKSRKNA